ncbi:hypothetical protein vseg_017784 [Gypsophila vaccaria]
MNRKKKNNASDVNDEVEELLRAAQDAALLKLTVNSHSVHASSSDLHPDLEQRFRNLRTGSKSEGKPKPIAKKTEGLESKAVKREVEDGDDDLLARFAALKASIPKPPNCADNLPGSNLVGTSNIVEDDEEDEEDEVEKVIRWAKDAARLDPSPPSDDDLVDDDDDVDDDSEKSDDDDDTPSRNRKSQRN